MTRQQRLKALIECEDKYGNQYFMQDGKVFLKPDESPRLRNIGYIDFSDNQISYMKYEEEKHRYRKTDAWSINWHIAQHVDVIYFITNQEGYKISREKARRFGDFLHFKSSTEKKIYVPVRYWTKRSEIRTSRQNAQKRT